MQNQSIATDSETGVANRGYTQLEPCPSSPNCVSTYATDTVHAIEPLPMLETLADTMQRLLDVVAEMKRTTVVERTSTYLHVEYRTRLGFVDDVEFVIDPSEETVHFRSASRVGYGDMGLNRRRMEDFRNRYARQ